jgi:large subunit ribosomal protein L23
MALFGKKTEKKAVKKTAEKAVAVKVSSETAPMKDIILRPRITEKSGIANEAQNIYTFEVTKNATKHSIARAVMNAYKVTPLKVRTVTLPGKKVFTRGHFGVQSPVKKAIVYLKKGEKIDIA